MTSRARKVDKLLPPTPEEEQAAYVASLERSGRAVAGRGPLPGGATHRIVAPPGSARRVKRKRFSAV